MICLGKMSQAQSPPQQVVTLQMLREQVNPLLRYFDWKGDAGKIAELTQAEQNLHSSGLGDLEIAVNMLQRIHDGIVQSDPTSKASKHSEALLERAQLYYAQAKGQSNESGYNA